MNLKRLLHDQKIAPKPSYALKPVADTPKLDSTGKVFSREFFKHGGIFIILNFLFMLASFGYFWYLASQPAYFYNVNNDNRYAQEQILDLAGLKFDAGAQNSNLQAPALLNFDRIEPERVKLSESVLELDLFGASTKLNNQAWIRTAKFKTYPPQNILFYHDIRQPLAILNLKAGLFLIDQDLVIIDKIKDSKNYTLPQLKLDNVELEKDLIGIKLDNFLVDSALNWIIFLRSSLVLPLDSVSQIDLSDSYNFLIKVKDPAITIRVLYNQIEDQIKRLTYAMPVLSERKNLQEIDLRVKDRVYIK